MKVFQLSEQEAGPLGLTHRFEIPYTDLTGTAGTTQTINLRTDVIAGMIVENAMFRVKTLFDGGATSELTLALGFTAGSTVTDGLLAATSIHADATYSLAGPSPLADVNSSVVDNTYGQQENDVITDLRTVVNKILRRQRKVFAATGNLTALFTSTGANLSTLTQGEVHIWLRCLTPGLGTAI